MNYFDVKQRIEEELHRHYGIEDKDCRSCHDTGLRVASQRPYTTISTCPPHPLVAQPSASGVPIMLPATSVST